MEVQIEDQIEEHEPRLSYAQFGSDLPNILARDAATCFCVSDKMLALGTQSGAVHLLDYDGNKIRTHQEHTAAVTDLSFDADAETLASSSTDGYVVLYGLYSGELQRIKCRDPVTAVALEPRHSHRKTKEFVYGTASGALILSSKGWLGNSETVLFQGRGLVHAVRMAGTMLAWMTDSGVRVYDTSSHTRIGKIDYPESARSSPGSNARCGMSWVGDTELVIGWWHHVMVLEIVQNQVVKVADGAGADSADGVTSSGGAGGSNSNSGIISAATAALMSPRGAIGSATTNTTTAAPTHPKSSSLEIASDFTVDENEMVLGVAPFGRQLAVLTWQEVSSTSPLNSEDAPPSPQSMQTTNATTPVKLHIFDRAGVRLFSDDIDLTSPIKNAKRPSPHQISLAAFFNVKDVVKPVAKNGALKQQQQPSRPSSPEKISRNDQQVPPSAGAAAASIPALPLTSTNTHYEEQQPYKWWSDGSEPYYYVISLKSIVLGRPRSASDRIAWLSERQRYPEALAVAESEPSIRPSSRLALGEEYLNHLFSRQEYQEAASLCPRILGDDVAAWERWVYTFGQAAHLPLLAPYLPTTDSPCVLSSSSYDMALSACLTSTADHELLKRLIDTWPQGIYDASTLLSKILPRLRPSSASGSSTVSSAAAPAALRWVAASLHSHVGHHEAALRLLLGLHSRSVFEYIKTHALEGLAASLAAELMDLNEVKATALLVESSEEAHPSDVVSSLQYRIDTNSEKAQNEEDQRVWSLRLYHYLDWLWQRDAAAAAPFAQTHVELCATYDPDRLLHLLTTSAAYPLDAALEVCESKGLIRESVYVLSRMGSTDAALRLIVERLRDVEEAVTFVQESRDDELWELLISLTLGDAALAGALLDHSSGAGVDPLKLVGAIPETMQIERLRDRLVRVIEDFRASLCLQNGCKAVLQADCLQLGDRLYRELTRALKRLHLLRPGGKWELYDAVETREQGGNSEEGSSLLVEPPPAAAVAVLGGTTAAADARMSKRVWIASTTANASSTSDSVMTPRGGSPAKRTLSAPASRLGSPGKFSTGAAPRRHATTSVL